VHEGHPLRGGGCLRDGPNVGVGAFRRRGTAGSEAAVLHTGAVHGACGSVSPRVAGVAWTLNKYNAAKGV